MASNAAAVSGLAPASATNGLPDVSPLKKGQVTYTAVVDLLAWTFAVYDLIPFGNLLPKIQQEFGWSNATASCIATFVGLASLVVALSVGPVIDRLGRPFALVLTTGGAALSSGLAAFAIGPLSLIVFRALSGFGMSKQAVNAAYLNEVFGPRAKASSTGSSRAAGPSASCFRRHRRRSPAAARLAGVFVVATFPLIVMLIFRFGLRESPYFVKIQHLRRLRAQGDVAACDQLAKQWSLDIEGDLPNTYAELFTPSLRRQSIALGAMFFFKIIADSQLTVLATSVLGQAKGIDLTSALWTIFFGNGVAVLGYLPLGWLGDRIGRRETVIIAQTLAAVCIFALLFVTISLATVVMGYALVLFFAQGAAAPFFAYVGESFPTRVRGSGAAFINITGPIGGIFGSLIYGALQQAGASPTIAAASGGVAALLAAACMLAARSIRLGQELTAISH